MMYGISTFDEIKDYRMFRYQSAWFQKKGKWARKISDDKAFHLISSNPYVGIILSTNEMGS